MLVAVRLLLRRQRNRVSLRRVLVAEPLGEVACYLAVSHEKLSAVVFVVRFLVEVRRVLNLHARVLLVPIVQVGCSWNRGRPAVRLLLTTRLDRVQEHFLLMRLLPLANGFQAGVQPVPALVKHRLQVFGVPLRVHVGIPDSHGLEVAVFIEAVAVRLVEDLLGATLDDAILRLLHPLHLLRPARLRPLDAEACRRLANGLAHLASAYCLRLLGVFLVALLVLVLFRNPGGQLVRLLQGQPIVLVVE